MKIDARGLQSILRAPDRFLGVLLHGDDEGLIRARGDQLTRAVVGNLDDPFRVVTLSREQQDTLLEEAMALSMTGGRRVVRVREASDTLVATLQRLVSGNAGSLLILEAPGLPSRARLRALADGHDKIVSLGCYPEVGEGLEATIRSALSVAKVTIEQDALAWLTDHLGADQALTHQELEKLVVYVGAGHAVDLEAAQACVGDAAAISLDDALFAATSGDVSGTDRALRLAQAGGLEPVRLLRAMLSHLQRLHKALISVAGGESRAAAMRAVRPAIFFRRHSEFLRALEIWRIDPIIGVMEAISAAELACKRTGAPDSVIAAHAVLTISRRAAQFRRSTPASVDS